MDYKDYEIDEYYIVKERKNAELVGCFCIFVVVLAIITVIGIVIEFFRG